MEMSQRKYCNRNMVTYHLEVSQMLAVCMCTHSHKNSHWDCVTTDIINMSNYGQNILHSQPVLHTTSLKYFNLQNKSCLSKMTYAHRTQTIVLGITYYLNECLEVNHTKCQDKSVPQLFNVYNLFSSPLDVNN